MTIRGVALFIVVAGCADSSPRISVEDNELGITSIEITHTGQGNDRLLTVTGFGKDDAELASLALRTGTVNYTPDDLLAPEPQLGTELSVSVGGHALGSVVTPQLLPHVQMLPVPVADPFLMLDAVARAVRDESGIELLPSMNKSLGEAAYETNCVGNLFQTNKGNPSQCCQLSAAYTAIYQKNANNILAYRFGYNPIVTCRQSDGAGRNCVGTGCVYGACGLKIDWTSTTTTGHVFKPNGATSPCGYDDSAGTWYPKTYNPLSDPLWPGVTAGCTMTTCCRTGNIAYPWNGGCPTGPVFFDNDDFLGAATAYGGDQSDLRTSGWNDRISSVLVPSGVSIRIWENIGYTGASMTVVSPGIVHLSDFGWNNRISSIDFL